MGKKSKRNRSKQSDSAGLHHNEQSRSPPAARSSNNDDKETIDNLHFEDPFPEEYDDDDDDDNHWDDQEEEGDRKPSATRDNDGGGDMEIIQSWNPLSQAQPQLAPGEQLEMDPTAYKLYHSLTPEWPALSFDFIRDSLGESRSRFPHSLIAAVGTQADRPEHNSLTVLKISELSKLQVETEDDILGEEFNPDNDHDDDDESDSDDEVDLDPVMEHYSIPHYGGVNRVRVMPQRPDIVATWSDVGCVNLFNVESIRQRFDVRDSRIPATTAIPTLPFFSYSKHKEEGYAMDWSLVKEGHLVTGDCSGSVHLWSPRPEGGWAVSGFYENNNSDRSVEVCPSVEDLQWSPSEATVFASAECGGFVRIFDTRASGKAQLSHKIHTNGADVNVLSWNRLVVNLLATGGDDGTLSVWDLRHFSKAEPAPLARFTPHKTPITSVEWHPTDESMLVASDDVGAYIYDLSVEEDDAAGQMDVPPQLLFVHSGSEQFKEIHWHPQISSCLMSTAATGFSVFIPSNL